MFGKRKWWPILGVAVVLLLLINLTVPVLAGENRTGSQVTVGPNEVLPDDLYAAGDIVTIDGTIKGDLIAFASEIRINGTVEGEVLGAARTIWVNGTVGDDVRVAAYELQIGDKGRIAHDVNVAAFSFEALNGSNIGGDIYAVAYQGQLNGKLDGSYRGATNGLYIDGEVGHDVLAEVAPPDMQFNQLQTFTRMSPVPVLGPGLHVADTAVISGALKYVSRGEAIIAAGAKVSQVIRETPTPAVAPRTQERPRERGFGWLVLFWIIAQLRRLITLIVVGLLLIWLLPRLIPEAAARLRATPWPSLGWGCVGEIAFFVSLPILLALIIGVGLLLGVITLGGLQTVFIGIGLVLEALWGLGFAVVTSYIAKIVIAFLIGTLLLEQARSKSVGSAFWPMLIGIILYIIVAAIPILGWFATLAATLFGLGALWLWARDQWWPPRSALVTIPAGGPAGPLDRGGMTMSPPGGPVVQSGPVATPPSTAAKVPEEASPIVSSEIVTAVPLPPQPSVSEDSTFSQSDLPVPPAEPFPSKDTARASEMSVPSAEPYTSEDSTVPSSEVLAPPTDLFPSEETAPTSGEPLTTAPEESSEVVALLAEPSEPVAPAVGGETPEAPVLAVPVPKEETAPSGEEPPIFALEESTPLAPEGEISTLGESEEGQGETTANNRSTPESTGEDQDQPQPRRRRRSPPKGEGK